LLFCAVALIGAVFRSRLAAGLVTLLYHYKSEPVGREKSSDKVGIKLSTPRKKKIRKLFFCLKLLQKKKKKPTTKTNPQKKSP